MAAAEAAMAAGAGAGEEEEALDTQAGAPRSMTTMTGGSGGEAGDEATPRRKGTPTVTGRT